MIISIPTHLLECLKCETLASNDQDLEQQAFLFIASRKANYTATVKDSVMVSCKTKHSLTLQPSHHTLWYFHKGVEYLMPTQKPAHGYLYKYYS